MDPGFQKEKSTSLESVLFYSYITKAKLLLQYGLHTRYGYFSIKLLSGIPKQYSVLQWYSSFMFCIQNVLYNKVLLTETSSRNHIPSKTV